MRKFFTFFIFIFCIGSWASPKTNTKANTQVNTQANTQSNGGFEVKPDLFWQSKPTLYQKIKEEQKIAVSVDSNPGDPGPPPVQTLLLRGGGHVKTPLDFTYKSAKQFSDLPKVSSYIKEASFNNINQELYVHSEAFGYHAKMTLKIQFIDQGSLNKKQFKQIKYKVIKGHFLGLEGVIHFEDYSRRITEISMTSIYNYVKLPMPQFFVEFGLEVVLQRVAAAMRSFIQKKYREGA